VLDDARAERGSAVVEFALVLPILLMVTLAVVQVGLVARDQLMVVQASRAGAREAAVSADEETVRSAAVHAAAPLDPNALDVEVSRAGALGEPVTVTVRYAESVRVPLVAWLFPSRISLQSSAVARQEFG
jgi:Flp pilus assembly protein TadG